MSSHQAGSAAPASAHPRATELVVGRTFTRVEIRAVVGGGDLQSYLPQANGRAIAGCFDPELNLRAPIEIDVGPGPVVVKSAKALVESGDTIPVFLKRAPNAWEFVGLFTAKGYSEAREDLARPSRRPNAVAVFYLEQATDEDQLLIAPPDPTRTFIEGDRVLVQHFRRERSRELVRAKRRLALSQGPLRCEACDLHANPNLGEAGTACFEVHHLLPLPQLAPSTVTRLDDLALLCANCHRIIHHIDPLPSLPEFRRAVLAAPSVV